MARSIGHEALGRGGRQRDTRGAQVLLAAILILVVGWLNVFNPNKSFETLWLGSLVVAMGFWPMLHWLGDSRRDAVPVLPLHGVFCAISYGMAGLQDEGRMFGLVWTSELQRQEAQTCVLLGLSGLYFGYYWAGDNVVRGTRALRWPFEVREAAYEWLVFLAYPILFAADMLIGLTTISSVGHVLNALYGFLFLLLVHALFSRRLRGKVRSVFLYVILPLQFVLGSGLAGGALAGLFVLSMSVGITYVAVRRRLPYALIFLIVSAVLLLNPVKAEFRGRTWDGQSSQVSLIAKVQMFIDLGWTYYFSDEASTLSRLEAGSTSTYDRVNHLMVMAAVVADTPERQPFLYGESYLPLLTKWIPRLVWTDKPQEDLGSTWARSYGYLGEDDYVTAFNLPWLPEMYMNFGVLGVVGVYLLIGILMRYLAINFWRVPKDSSAFAFGMMLGVPLMIGDTNLSLVLGATVINAVSLLLLCYLAAKCVPRLFSWNGASR